MAWRKGSINSGSADQDIINNNVRQTKSAYFKQVISNFWQIYTGVVGGTLLTDDSGTTSAIKTEDIYGYKWKYLLI